MTNWHVHVVESLRQATRLPVHYEMTLHSGLKTPCISYMEISNTDELNGNTHGYSRISYQVKVWANDIALIQQYAGAVDGAMRPMGFKRIGAVELYDTNSTMIQKVMTYEVIAYEEY